MMDLTTIKHIDLEFVRSLTQTRRIPYVPFDLGEVEEYLNCPCQRRLPFPVLGERGPPGWKLVDVMTLSERTLRRPRTAGFGRLLARLRWDLALRGTRGYAVVGRRDNRIVLGIFSRTKVVRARPHRSAQGRQIDPRSPVFTTCPKSQARWSPSWERPASA